MKTLQDQINELKKGNQNQHAEYLETKQPFSIELLATGLPSKFRLPNMKSYKGTSDPIEHLETYQNLMELHNFSDATKCRAFHLTLTGIARQWYQTLHPRTISTFSDLAGAFVSQFLVHKVHEKPAHHMSTMRQRENERTMRQPAHLLFTVCKGGNARRRPVGCDSLGRTAHWTT
ncbi:hypothetical protein UlMin_023473 [Ulmus minor]